MLNKLMLNLLNTVLMCVRYGLVAWAISCGAGYGCRKWPLIKEKKSEDVSIERTAGDLVSSSACATRLLGHTNGR